MVKLDRWKLTVEKNEESVKTNDEEEVGNVAPALKTQRMTTLLKHQCDYYYTVVIIASRRISS